LHTRLFSYEYLQNTSAVLREKVKDVNDEALFEVQYRRLCMIFSIFLYSLF